MKTLGVIGGSGFYEFPELENISTHSLETEYGRVESVVEGFLEQKRILFLARHGTLHNIPPHKVNYRANIQALYQLGVSDIIGINASGGIGEYCSPGTFVIPDQIIDYTYGREHTFFDGFKQMLEHVDFTDPFDNTLRNNLINIVSSSQVSFLDYGTYACTQGPRLETRAEINKLRNDGCDLVGMTMMPESALAREKAIPYASLSLIVNWAAGVSEELISLNNIMALLKSSVPQIRDILLKTVRFL